MPNTKCFVDGCCSTVHNTQLFRFPSKLDRIVVWAKSIGKPCTLENARFLRCKMICGNHFSADQFFSSRKNRLKLGAVPSLSASTPVSNSLQYSFPVIHLSLPPRTDPSLLQTDNYLSLKHPSKTYFRPKTKSSTHSSSSDSSPVSTITTTTSTTTTIITTIAHTTTTTTISTATSTTPSIDLSFPDLSVTPISHDLNPIVTSTPLPCTSTCITSNEAFSTDSNAYTKARDGSRRARKPLHGSSKPKAKRSLLQQINERKVSNLTPRKKKLYKIIRSKDNSLCRLRRKFRKKVSKEASLEDCDQLLVDAASHYVKEEALVLLRAIFRNCKQKPRGRRWSTDDKIIALTLQKRSPKGYGSLSDIFPLPSPRTLQTLLNSVPFGTGINPHLFSTVTTSMRNKSEANRLCCLMFDEMSIREHLHYNQKYDRIDGYQDHGSQFGRSNEIANHALVFMVRGLRENWKQPVAYYFSHSGTKGEMLVKLLVQVLDECQKAGLRVIATVCDMGSNNVRALKILGCTDDKPYFSHGNQTIYTVFDPPHLLKCTRNMFLKHYLRYEVDVPDLDTKEVRVAKWDHILDMHEYDKKDDPLYRMAKKLHDRNLKPQCFSLMKVSYAAQVLSNSVATALHVLHKYKGYPIEYRHTADFLLMVDQLYDSFNGGAQRKTPKKMRCRLDDSSPHIPFWRDMRAKISCWSFFGSRTNPSSLPSTSASNKTIYTPTLRGWRVSMAAVEHVWNEAKKAGLGFLVTRNLNQDPLENTFGAVRAHCGANYNPNVKQFEDALKTCIINRLAAGGLRGSNCERDGARLLDNFHSFFGAARTHQVDESTANATETSEEVIDSTCDVTELEEEVSIQDSDSLSLSVPYVSGYVAKRLFHGTSCEACKYCLVAETSESSSHYPLIHTREYEPGNEKLYYPSIELVRTLIQVSTVLVNELGQNGHKDKIKAHLTSVIEKNVDFKWCVNGCLLHHQELQKRTIDAILKISIPWWCVQTNRQLVVKKSGGKRKMNILSHS